MHAALKRLSAVGSHGEYPGNARRDRLRSFCKNMSVPKPITVTLKLKTKTLNVIDGPVRLLNPAEVIDTLFTYYPAQFDEAFDVDPSKFWEGIKADDPRLAKLGDMTASPSWQKRCIPLVLHGDGAPFTTKNEHSLIVVNLKGLLAKKSQWIVPLAIIVKNSISDEHKTFEYMWAVLRHLLNSCFHGKHSDVDPWGHPWPRGAGNKSWQVDLYAMENISSWCGNYKVTKNGSATNGASPIGARNNRAGSARLAGWVHLTSSLTCTQRQRGNQIFWNLVLVCPLYLDMRSSTSLASIGGTTWATSCTVVTWVFFCTF